MRALNAPIPRLRDKVTSISDDLDNLAARALARPPGERFQSAVEMAAAIEQVAKGSIASAREVTALVIDLFGQELDQRRTDVRSWLDEGPAAATSLAPPPAPIQAPEPLIAAVVAEPAGDDAEPAAEAQEPPESVTVARPRLESLASIPREESEPIAVPPQLLSPRPSAARRVLTLGAGLAVMALEALGALLSKPHPTATATPMPIPAIVTTAATTATTATTAAATASAAEVPAAAPSEVAAPVAAPLTPARPAASSSVKPAAPAKGPGSGEDLENPYR